ncbi:DUF6376 family protein [Paenibacillus qinlingensis]|uniref:PBP1b-binding outer membrane lipoprotein LpoB n=1 Tax=Paenibacillus qinlingensis TaxID=1837343 RepID=A0ABU1NRP0_9BACL|nr:DUF6376 family protein [Paenibacillus qinlingensis]MDR6550152.1 PBP1b-binding outer membrane lipoprotein LpoB [Paenibacillus qinlingensis]
MKKWILILALLSTMFASGCSLLEKANQTVDYGTQATEHLTNLREFAEQAPQMIKDAATNPETKQELENKLLDLKKEIEQFNLSSVPSMAKDIHQQIVEKNKILLDEINKVIVNGHLALDKLQNSQIITTISDAANLLNRIQNLGL